jgi:hypothetical protein
MKRKYLPWPGVCDLVVECKIRGSILSTLKKEKKKLWFSPDLLDVLVT